MSHSNPELLVYKASAGSGKTFTLAVNYICQLIEDPTAYRRILAVTFTNKATAEMKERILEQLDGIAERCPDSDGYLKEIQKRTGKAENEIRRSAGKALTNIIHDYSRFRIETIDSFFQSVLRNLARELNLGAGLSIELNNKEVLSDAVDILIEKLDRNSPVLYWLIEYIEEKIENDKRWNVSEEIKSFGWNIFDESYIEKGEKLREKLADPHFLPNYKKELENIQAKILKQMKDFSEKYLSALSANGLDPADLIKKSSGISGYFRKLGDGKLGDDICNATVRNCLEDAGNWASKTSPKRDIIRQLAASSLLPLLQEAEKVRPKNNMILNSCKLSLRYLNNLRLLANIYDEINLLNREHNRFLLSETNALLHNLMAKGDASFIYEKIGTTVDTVMIDEFQDTSRMQWENFHLLLEESLAQKEGSLIVGDIKQSIYRWRNGDWRILANIKKDPAFRTRECTLDTNWRSETNIIRFNNGIFKAASLVLDERYREETGNHCTDLTEAYADVEQKTPKKDNRGYVKLAFLPNSKEHPYAESMLEQLAAEVERLVGQGIAVSDIAILVRKNKAIPEIAGYFEQHTSHRIVSDEAFRLDASPAANMLVDGLRLFAFPDDSISLARLAATYQQEILHKDTALNTILLEGAEKYLPAELLLRKDTLMFMPLYELLETLASIFNIREIKGQDAYLCAFYDAVTLYVQDNSSDIAAFIAYWEEVLHEKTIPSGEIDGIRILSIHKSKGLEYHTVLIPFCDWKMENETNSHLVWCSLDADNPDFAPFNELDLAPINYSKDMAQSVYHDCYQTEHLQLWVDNLNLLYVAFTRACKNLIVLGKQKQANSVSELLREAVERLDFMQTPEPDPSGECPEEGDTCEIYEFGSLCTEQEGRKQSANRLKAKPETISMRVESLTPEIEFKQSNKSAEFIRGDEDDKAHYIQQGQLLHSVFASIRRKSDLEQAIGNLRFNGIFETEEQERRTREIAEKALENPVVADWFDGGWELYNECSIIFRDEEGGLQTRRPDRVMKKDGRVVVVDFKFGKKHDAYRQQVREYMELLTRMGHKHVEGYLWYVFADELERINCDEQHVS